MSIGKKGSQKHGCQIVFFVVSSRALTFVSNNFAGEIPAVELMDDDKELLALITRELKSYLENMEKIRYSIVVLYY